MNKDSINVRDSVGATRLFEAVSDNNIKEVKLLLSKGADPNVPENNGITPLMDAASGGDLAMVKLLLKHGAKADLKDNFGSDAINYAESQGYGKVVTYLRSIK